MIEYKDNYCRCKNCKSHLIEEIRWERHFGYCGLCLVMLYFDRAAPEELERIVETVERRFHIVSTQRRIDCMEDSEQLCKCKTCRYVSTPQCKVINGTYSKVAYCRGPYKE